MLGHRGSRGPLVASPRRHGAEQYSLSVTLFLTSPPRPPVAFPCFEFLANVSALQDLDCTARSRFGGGGRNGSSSSSSSSGLFDRGPFAFSGRQPAEGKRLRTDACLESLPFVEFDRVVILCVPFSPVSFVVSRPASQVVAFGWILGFSNPNRHLQRSKSLALSDYVTTSGAVSWQ